MDLGYIVSHEQKSRIYRLNRLNYIYVKNLDKYIINIPLRKS